MGEGRRGIYLENVPGCVDGMRFPRRGSRAYSGANVMVIVVTVERGTDGAALSLKARNAIGLPWLHAPSRDASTIVYRPDREVIRTE